MANSLKEICDDISYLEMIDIFHSLWQAFMTLFGLAWWFWTEVLPKLRAWRQRRNQGPAGGNQMDLLDLP